MWSIRLVRSAQALPGRAKTSVASLLIALAKHVLDVSDRLAQQDKVEPSPEYRISLDEHNRVEFIPLGSEP